MDLAGEAVEALKVRGLRIATAESLTGGMLVAEMVRIPGASAVVLGGVVAYATELKHRLLHVDDELLREHGPVHPEVALQMADGVRAVLMADVGVSTTGVAGPTTQGGQAVGAVHVAVTTRSTRTHRACQFTGSREQIRRSAVEAALDLVLAELCGGGRE